MNTDFEQEDAEESAFAMLRRDKTEGFLGTANHAKNAKGGWSEQQSNEATKVESL